MLNIQGCHRFSQRILCQGEDGAASRRSLKQSLRYMSGSSYVPSMYPRWTPTALVRDQVYAINRNNRRAEYTLLLVV